MADDANRSMAALASDGNPRSVETIDAGGAAGSRRLARTAANHLTHVGTRIPILLETIYSGAGGRQGDATSLVTGSW
jgi:hypothetical protein